MSEQDSITIIGRGAHIKGEITFDTPARILGTVEGTIHTKNEIYIGETAQCKAAVYGTSVLVDGTVEGSLFASDRVELTARCVVKGDITAGALVVADGASFMGFCRVGPEAIAEQAAPRQERAPLSLQMNHETARPAERPAAAARPTPERTIPERIVIADKPGLEVKPALSGTGHATTPATTGTTPTQPRPRARTADWLPPATPAFPAVVTKTNDWNGTPASA